jgi:hypothetical protein
MRLSTGRRWRHCPTWGSARRGGAVLVEFLLVMPILLVALAGVIEYGLILSNLQQVALASRVGAKVASEQPTPLDITAIHAAVDQQLKSAGFSGACRVILQHNVPGGGPSPQTTGACDCNMPLTPGTPATTHGRFVRVTVCVELSELTPDLLDFFGFSVAGRLVEETTTYRWEGY